MMGDRSSIIVLALGNDLLGDDGVGWEAARQLAEQVPPFVHIVETGEAGLALLELLEGYDRALLLDSVVTGEYPPGTVVELSPEAFRRVIAPSPHYAGLPEVLEMARQLQLHFPQEIRILAMEVQQPDQFHVGLTPPVRRALPDFVERARRILHEWLQPARN